jgi:hypothetical protein
VARRALDRDAPEPSAPGPVARSHRTRRIVLWTSAALVLAGGAVAASLLLTRRDEAREPVDGDLGNVPVP